MTSKNTMGEREKKKERGGGGKKKEEEEMIKRRVIQSVKSRGGILGGIVEQVGNEMGYFEPLIFSC